MYIYRPYIASLLSSHVAQEVHAYVSTSLFLRVGSVYGRTKDINTPDTGSWGSLHDRTTADARKVYYTMDLWTRRTSAHLYG